MNKQQLASKIWESANKMRSKIEASEYKDYILGFIFYKFLSDKEEDFLIKDGWEKDNFKRLNESDEQVVEYCQSRIGYFIAYENLFSTWLKMGSDFDVSCVRDALSAFSRLINISHKKVFEEIFKTLETGLSDLGESTGSQTKAISDLLYLIKDIPMDGKQDYDVLGFIYEYLISMFAANAGKKAGEFYTPHEVSFLMSEIVAEHLKDREKIEIYDPTSGSGSLLINIGKSVSKRMSQKNNIKYYAQELKESTYNLTRMNLIMRGILPANICTRNNDTLLNDWPYFDESDPSRTYTPLYVDAVVSNPPYSQAWDPTDRNNDPRYKRYGLAPKTKADYAFLLHDLYHVKSDGIMTIVLPHGVLFRGGEEEKIRKNLIEYNNIDTIIGLPANIFYGTGIPTIIMILKQRRSNTDVLIIDASKGFEKVGKNNKLRACDIKKIIDAYINRKDIDKFAKVVSRDTIRDNVYNLNIPRYVDSSEKSESWDIYATVFGGIPNSEIDDLKNYWVAFPTLKSQLFAATDTPFSSVKVDDINNVISSNEEVVKFMNSHNEDFSDFEQFLNTLLIDNALTISPNQQENVIADEIFSRLKNTPLIDKYNAYQLLDNAWKNIQSDLEIIQTEGFSSTKKVDPNMVTKKKNEKEVEVQEGWKGRIIPFEIIQTTLLKEDYNNLRTKEERLTDITSEYSEILDNFSEEEKDEYREMFNEDKDAFVNKEVIKIAKSIGKEDYQDESVESRIIHLNTLIDKEKAIKKDVKILSDKLQKETKIAIENLSDEQVKEMLNLKWIKPLCNEILVLPQTIVSELENKINALTKKYSVTMLDLEAQIEECEKSFASMIDDLTGDDYDMKGLKELQTLLKGGEK